MAASKASEAVVVRDSRGSGRETVESVVVAFTLALIFKAFEAEAFVIPTGSMATTLMGRHKDLVCEACGETFRVGSSREVDEAAGRVNEGLAPTRGDCPNCGRVNGLDRGAIPWHDPKLDSFNGDRILVDKVAYDFREPARWDVVVFKYPEDARTNYIKRLVGLPGETVTIAGGDIWTSRDGGEPVIARKPADTLVAMLQCVHDSRHVAGELVAAGWPAAWTDWSGADAAGPSWKTADGGRSFAASCAGGGVATLRFRRILPDAGDWETAAAGGPLAGRGTPALVGDFQAYNDGRPRRQPSFRDTSLPVDGAHWVGDLAVEADLESGGATGSVTLDLVEAGVTHACTIDLSDGSATLVRRANDGAVEATARTPVRGRGRWRVLLANVDDELSLFVNGGRIACAGTTAWTRRMAEASAAPVGGGAEPGAVAPGDLAPAGITVRDADVRLDGLRVLRDVYYIASGDAAVMAGVRPEPPSVSYPLAAGQFFMLGDNSAASKDSRAWGTPERPLHHVDRHLIVGRALAVFWPHGVPTSWSIPLKIGTWELRLPFVPNFGRMRFVR